MGQVRAEHTSGLCWADATGCTLRLSQHRPGQAGQAHLAALVHACATALQADSAHGPTCLASGIPACSNVAHPSCSICAGYRISLAMRSSCQTLPQMALLTCLAAARCSDAAAQPQHVAPGCAMDLQPVLPSLPCNTRKGQPGTRRLPESKGACHSLARCAAAKLQLQDLVQDMPRFCSMQGHQGSLTPACNELLPGTALNSHAAASGCPLFAFRPGQEQPACGCCCTTRPAHGLAAARCCTAAAHVLRHVPPCCTAPQPQPCPCQSPNKLLALGTGRHACCPVLHCTAGTQHPAAASMAGLGDCGQWVHGCCPPSGCTLL